MQSPWLSVPLDDYEGHMSAPGVGQLGALADLFAEALAQCRPESLAILGIAGGNGLDRIDPSITRRVIGFDIHPGYLDAVRRRHPGLTLHCIDLAEQTVTGESPVELVHAALVFEHAGTDRCLDNATSLVAPEGSLSVVLQLPSTVEQNVGPSPFSSMQALSSHFSLVQSGVLSDILQRRGFRLVHEDQRALPAGKAFWLGIFQR